MPGVKAPEPSTLRRVFPPLGFFAGLLVFLQAAKALSFFRGVNVSLPLPVLNVDFAVYYAGALRMHEFLAHAGRAWGYDPYQMAGYPSYPAVGLLLEAVPHFLSWAVSIGRSLLLMEFVGMFSLPFLAWLAAFVWKGEARLAWIVFFIVAATHGLIEPISRLFLQKGLFPFQVAVFASLCQAAFFLRWVRDNSWKNWALQTFFSIVSPLIHPTALVMVFLPCVVLTFQALRRPPKWFLVQLLLSAALVTAANWPWLEPTLGFWSWGSATDYMKGFRLNHLFGFYGFWGPTAMERFASIANLLFLTAAAAGLYRLGKTRKAEAVFFSSWLVFYLLLVGFGGDVGLASLQPFRYCMPFWILIYALSAFEMSRWLGASGGRRAAAIGAFSLTGVLVCAGVSNDSGWPRLSNEWTDSQTQFIRRLENDGAPGRWLVECRELDDPHFMEFLALHTGRPLLGGPYGSSLLASKFTLFVTGTRPVIFERFLENMDETEFGKYMDLYDVTRIGVTSSPGAACLGRFKTLLSEDAPVDGYRIFKVNRPADWFVQGRGEVSAGLDRIEIRGASRGTLVLKYHWLSTLKTVPSVPMMPVHLMDDPVPFIKIDNARGADTILVVNGGFHDKS